MFEQRPYFVFGDVVSNAAAGALASVTMAAVVDVGWVMPVAMGVGMVMGGLVGTLLSFGAAALFGTMEVMIPMMMTGKTTGMLVAVTASTHVIPTGTAAVNGPVVGVVVLAVTYVANAVITSKEDVWTS